MTTTEYWTTPAAAALPAVAGPKKDHGVLNWRLMLAIGLNIAAWAAILKSL